VLALPGRSSEHDPEQNDVVLLATGVGIGPFLPLGFRLLSGGSSAKVTLYWGLRLDEDICLTNMFDDWASSYPNFRYRNSLSQPPAGWQGLRGRLTESVPPQLESVTGTTYFLCGNGAMIIEMTEALSLVGVPQRRLIDEPFFNLRHRPDLKVVEAICARFRATDVLSSPFAEVARFLKS
jgi:ferredoxin-NADP reductase